ncbi:MAG: hypothetical protein WDZ94_04025 [Patescibacteria group bacterium]
MNTDDSLPTDSDLEDSSFQPQHSRTTFFKKKLLLLLLLFVGIGAVVAGYSWYQNQQPTAIDETVFQDAQGVIATVGEEQIFQSDLEQIIPLLPASENTQEQGLEVLVNHSIILQAAQEEGVIGIPSELFNKPYKNQSARFEFVDQVRQTIESNFSVIQGSVVSIYFLNESPGIIGYEAGREFAQQKINAIHQQVTNGEITMQQAGQMIAADAELERVDSAFRSNAYFEFSAGPDEGIVIDPDLDPAIRALDPGEVSSVLVGKGMDLSDWSPTSDVQVEVVDAMFMFAQVDKKETNLEYNSFDEWLEAKRMAYQVSYE